MLWFGVVRAISSLVKRGWMSLDGLAVVTTPCAYDHLRSGEHDVCANQEYKAEADVLRISGSWKTVGKARLIGCGP
jgi:hypothetical protein